MTFWKFIATIIIISAVGDIAIKMVEASNNNNTNKE